VRTTPAPSDGKRDDGVTQDTAMASIDRNKRGIFDIT
jgi:hypothetical protein